MSFNLIISDHKNLWSRKNNILIGDWCANNNNILVIPVGIAFENAYIEKPKIKLHKHYDGNHPSLLGTYLAAAVVFSSVTQKSPKNIKYNYYDAIGDLDIQFLQKIAHETVEDFYSINLK